MSQRFLKSTAVVGLAVLGLAVGSAPASASTIGPIKSSCSGQIVDSRALIGINTGQYLGRVELWYSAANGGQNCVITHISVPRVRLAQAVLRVDRNNNRRWDGTTVDAMSSDSGAYTSFAGASYRNNTNGHCIEWSGGIWADDNDAEGSPNTWVHCG